jgi:hypothetical protein
VAPIEDVVSVWSWVLDPPVTLIRDEDELP